MFCRVRAALSAARFTAFHYRHEYLSLHTVQHRDRRFGFYIGRLLILLFGIAPRKDYTKEQMAKAIDEVRKGEKISVAVKRYGVPRITLHNKITGKSPIDCNLGPATVLTHEEERILVKWITFMAEKHFPVTKEQLLDSVQKIISEKNLDSCHRD